MAEPPPVSSWQECLDAIGEAAVLDKTATKNVKAKAFLEAVYKNLLTDADRERLRADLVSMIVQGNRWLSLVKDLFGVLIAFRRNGKAQATEPPSIHSFNPGPQAAREELVNSLLREVLVEGRPSQQALRNLVLIRHNGICPVTGKFADTKVLTPEEEELVDAELAKSNVCQVPVEAAHVIPVRLVHTGTEEPEATARAWQYLDRYFGPSITPQLPDLNSPTNALLLDVHTHRRFITLNAGFQSIPGEDGCYTLINFRTGSAREFPAAGEVSFQSANGVQGANPKLLEIHLALCRIMHACGAAKAIDALLNDMDATRTLGDDSAHLLSTALDLVQLGETSSLAFAQG